MEQKEREQRRAHHLHIKLHIKAPEMSCKQFAVSSVSTRTFPRRLRAAMTRASAFGLTVSGHVTGCHQCSCLEQFSASAFHSRLGFPAATLQDETEALLENRACGQHLWFETQDERHWYQRNDTDFIRDATVVQPKDQLQDQTTKLDWGTSARTYILCMEHLIEYLHLIFDNPYCKFN